MLSGTRSYWCSPWALAKFKAGFLGSMPQSRMVRSAPVNARALKNMRQGLISKIKHGNFWICYISENSSKPHCWETPWTCSLTMLEWDRPQQHWVRNLEISCALWRMYNARRSLPNNHRSTRCIEVPACRGEDRPEWRGCVLFATRFSWNRHLREMQEKADCLVLTNLTSHTVVK